jgi:predicted NBD/HSP70 family sugar kinase
MKYMTRRPPRTNNQQMMKEENIKLLFNLIAERPGMTRVQLGRMTQLSPTTVSTLVDELMQNHLVEETGLAVTQCAGRKPILLRVAPEGRQIAQFSLTRSGILFALYGLNQQVLESRYLPHPADAYGGFVNSTSLEDPDAGDDYMALIEQMLQQSKRCNRERLLAVCITLPGVYLQQDDAFSWSAMRVRIGGEAVRRLESRLSVPFFLGNASMCRAYAEKKCLEQPGTELQDLIYVNVCDGLGAGIIAGGEFLVGNSFTAGEIGHITVDIRGKRCSCGQNGCVEQYVNLNAIREQVEQAWTGDPACTGSVPTTLEKIGRLWEEGHRVISAVMEDVTVKLFSAIYATLCITGIKRVVIGGGIEQLGPYLLDHLQRQARQNAHNLLIRDMSISFAQSGLNGDGDGIVAFYLDHVFNITADEIPQQAQLVESH